MDLATILRIVDWIGRIAIAIGTDHPAVRPAIYLADSVVTCEDCGAEPWAVRWGRVRLGYDLSGYFSQLSSDGAPRIICRECWERSLGIEGESGAP